MTARRTGLGRGIGALIPGVEDQRRERPSDVYFPVPGSTAAPGRVSVSGSAGPEPELVRVPGARLEYLNPNDIVPNRAQPRTVFNEDELAELVHSVREFGVLQPIVVREHPDQPGTYELVMGERRLRATKLAGLPTIPAVVKDTESDALLRDALLENLHRSQLNPLEEASAYQQLLADFGITQEDLAKRIGRSRSQIANTIRLLRLPEPVQLRVAAGVLTAGHARAILALADHDAMQRVAEKIVREDLSVRQVEAMVSEEPVAVLPRRPRLGQRQAFLDDLAARLGDRLDTNVRIRLTAKKGQITVDFSTVDDLRRIAAEFGVDATGR